MKIGIGGQPQSRYNAEDMRALGESASDRVLGLLKQAETGLSVKELCQRLHLSSMAVRRQLTLLEVSDLLFSEKEKQKIGRPAFRYYLTEKGHEQFERDYANLVVDLLVSLRSMDGKTKISQIFEKRKTACVEKAQPKVLGRTLEARVHEVTRLLTEDGYMARWEKLGPKKFLIKEMNCPVAQVAKKFPHVCIYEEKFLSELLQAKVTRRHHLLQKDHFCSYLVEG
ncbi:MAG: HTH domain-containing protein [Acidobacteria bacterium]|nr:HTH domain-containing protein [Acidobacteriota bacterium]